MSTVIKVENVSKQYRLGEVGTGSIAHDMNRWWHKVQRKEDPYLTVGETNDRTTKGGSDYAWALKDVSFKVNQGDAIGLIGKNGAGKSTMLKILSRVTQPTHGNIKIKGRIASLLEVGTGFHPELTGKENIYLNGAILGMRKREISSKLDEIVDFSGCQRYIDTPVKRYSSGMYVRLAFAVAAHLEPEILIVDEVLAVGDAEFQRRCLGKMKDVTGEGRTVIFVSHNLLAVQKLCERCILFKNGELSAEGSCQDIIAEHIIQASELSNGFVDLTNHPARSSTSTPVIRGITLRDKSEEVSINFDSHEPFVVDIEVAPLGRIANPRVAIAIEDSTGQRIMTMASYFEEVGVPDFEKTTTIRCYVDGLNMGGGRYLLSVSVATKELGLIDSIDNAIWFEIATGKEFQSEETYDSCYGPVLKQSKWTVRG